MTIPIIVGAAVALAVSLLVTPQFRRVAHRVGLVDRPDAVLKPHAKPTAYLGGAAIWVGLAAGLGAAWIAGAAWGGGAFDWRKLWAVLICGGLMGGVGLLDDAKDIRPRLRVALESAVAVLLFVAGVRFEALPGLDGPVAVIVALAFQWAFVLGACNATNLLDGLDGLCASGITVVAIGLAALAGGLMFFAAPESAMMDRLSAIVLIGAVLAGSLLGFLRYNYRPASIFMGDAGSLLLGFVVAACLILLAAPSVPPGHGGQGASAAEGVRLVLAGLAVFGLPITDTALAFARRIVNRQPLSVGDRSHLYDQLVDRGWSVARTVNACALIALGFAALGVAVGLFVPSLAVAAAILVGSAVGAMLLLWGLGFIRRP